MGVLCALFVLALLASPAVAAVCPQNSTLGTIAPEEGVFNPFSVAVDASGRTYVTDSIGDALLVFDYEGHLVKRKKVIFPLGVAIDAEGRIYVGRVDEGGGSFTGEVTVYDANLNPLFKLGRGYGQFKYPAAIATDADRVYVTDSRANRVKVFSKTDGSYLFKIGKYGTSASSLVQPNGIAVHPDTGNLYIMDRSLFYDTNGYALGVGIKIFTREGTFVKKFGSFGYDNQVGIISLPGGIAVDGAGRVLVSDFNNGNLHVFESSGANVCLSNYSSGEASFPQGLTISPDGRLLVAASGRVIELGIGTEYSKLTVAPGEMEFSAQTCGAQPAVQNITVSNDGGAPLDFTVSDNSAWLTVAQASGTLAGNASADIAVTVNKDGLAVGEHHGTIRVSSTGAEFTVGVVLKVLPPSVLTVSDTFLSFNIEGDMTPPSQSLIIELAGGGQWSAVTGVDSPWLGITPSAGPSGISTWADVSVDVASLASGDYAGTITVGASCATGSPVVVNVSLAYERGGTIDVTTNIDEAGFTLTGPETYSGDGKSFNVEGAFAGTFTIEFDDVPGFITPDSYSLDVELGGTTAFVGEYIDLRERLNILAAMGQAGGNVQNELNIFDGDGGWLELVSLQSPVQNGKYFWRNAIPASGDIDGDGDEELVVSHDVGVITVLEADGSVVGGFSVMPFAARGYIDVATADFDGDGSAEVVAGSMNWSSNGAQVRVLGYAGGTVYDTGINFQAYTGADYTHSNKNDRRGTKVATGDIDGDGIAEILTVQGGGYSQHNIIVRIFKVDTTGGPGNWTVTAGGEIIIDDFFSYYSDITAGDINADGVDEIVVSGAPLKTTEYQDVKVIALSASGQRLLEFTAPSIRGVDVAAGDLDFDGAAEIVVGEGAFNEGDSSRVRVYGSDGALRGEFLAFDGEVYGVRIAVGSMVQY